MPGGRYQNRPVSNAILVVDPKGKNVEVPISKPKKKNKNKEP